MTHSTEDREDSEPERTVTLRYPSWYPINNNTTNLGGIYTQDIFQPPQVQKHWQGRYPRTSPLTATL